MTCLSGLALDKLIHGGDAPLCSLAVPQHLDIVPVFTTHFWLQSLVVKARDRQVSDILAGIMIDNFQLTLIGIKERGKGQL